MHGEKQMIRMDACMHHTLATRIVWHPVTHMHRCLLQSYLLQPAPTSSSSLPVCPATMRSTPQSTAATASRPLPASPNLPEPPEHLLLPPCVERIQHLSRGPAHAGPPELQRLPDQQGMIAIGDVAAVFRSVERDPNKLVK